MSSLVLLLPVGLVLVLFFIGGVLRAVRSAHVVQDLDFHELQTIVLMIPL